MLGANPGGAPVEAASLAPTGGPAADQSRAQAGPPAGAGWSWGSNGHGQLGSGSVDNRLVALPVSNLATVTAVSAGQSHALAVTSGGTVSAWGANYYGQLGLGASSPDVCNGDPCSRTPQTVSGVSGATAVAAGTWHSLALKSDGSLRAWGWNEQGQLGATSGDTCVWGTATDACSRTPLPVSGISGATAVAAGVTHSLALLNDGKMRAWGSNGLGQLGNGNNHETNQKVRVGGNQFGGVTAIAAGSNHNLALKSNGDVWGWGYNNDGQVGNGTSAPGAWIDSPVQVVGVGNQGFLTGIVAVAAGTNFSLALKSNGEVVAWGENTGTLGNGTTVSSATPVAVLGLNGQGVLSGIAGIAAGPATTHALARGSDGRLWAWGQNWVGALGDGSTTQRLTPVVVRRLVAGQAIAAGGSFSLAVDRDLVDTIIIGGPARVVPIGTAGQNAHMTFNSPGAQLVTLTISAVTMSSAIVSIQKPDATTLVMRSVGIVDGLLGPTTLTDSGTYTIFVDPQGSSIGSMTLNLQTSGSLTVPAQCSPAPPGSFPKYWCTWVADTAMGGDTYTIQARMYKGGLGCGGATQWQVYQINDWENQAGQWMLIRQWLDLPWRTDSPYQCLYDPNTGFNTMPSGQALIDAPWDTIGGNQTLGYQATVTMIFRYDDNGFIWCSNQADHLVHNGTSQQANFPYSPCQ